MWVSLKKVVAFWQGKIIVSKSSTDNFWSWSVPAPDWLIFWCENVILPQKNKNENDKKTNFIMKNNNKMAKKYIKIYMKAYEKCPVI